MNIEIWSDISCPWCYIGRRRFENALQQFEHREQVQITWRSFQLDPDAPLESTESIVDSLSARKGLSRNQVEAMIDQVTGLAAEEGLDFHFETLRPANTFTAHRLLHLAAARGLQSELKERLQKAHFCEGLSVSDPDTLVRLAVEAGLDADEVRQTLQDPNAYTQNVRSDIRQARAFGINGVPFFVFDRKYGVSGAQASEVFLSVLQKAFEEPEQEQTK
jgi:predicted DsbA family dithiol-disulfide isomerase